MTINIDGWMDGYWIPLRIMIICDLQEKKSWHGNWISFSVIEFKALNNIEAYTSDLIVLTDWLVHIMLLKCHNSHGPRIPFEAYLDPGSGLFFVAANIYIC